MREGARAGIDDFLPKPIELDELQSRLRAAEQLVRAVRVLERIKDDLQPLVAIPRMEDTEVA